MCGPGNFQSKSSGKYVKSKIPGPASDFIYQNLREWNLHVLLESPIKLKFLSMPLKPYMNIHSPLTTEEVTRCHSDFAQASPS